MNVLDFVAIGIVIVCVIIGYRQGLIRTVYRLASFFLAIFLTTRLYPYMARLLRATPLFTSIQARIASAMNLDGIVGGVNEVTAARQTQIINGLPLPETLRGILHSANTPDMHEILRVTTVEEYISGFLANIAINVIAVIVTFLLVLLILWLLGRALDIVGRLPIVRTFNHAGGVVFGLILGVFLAWIGLVVMTFIFVAGVSVNETMYEMMRNSFFAIRVIEQVLPQLVEVV